MPLHTLVGERVRELHFMRLFLLLLFVLLTMAMFPTEFLMQFVIGLLYLNALLSVLSIGTTSQYFRFGIIAIWITSVVFKFFALINFSVTYYVIAKIMSCLLLIAIVIKIMQFIFSSRNVSGDTLFAAMVVYLFLAMLFGGLYSAIGTLMPDSFNMPKNILTDQGFIPEIEYIYFSLVTIATLGYGDITPAHPVTQILAAIEAVMGQFYVAIIVAWLVSLYIMHHQDKRQ